MKTLVLSRKKKCVFAFEGNQVLRLSRELFSAFWQSAEERVFEGNLEKIPIITPETTNVFLPMGSILSHGYVLIPLYFAKTLIADVLCENNCLVHDLLYESFLGYIDATESESVRKYLAMSQDSAYLLQEVIIPMLSRFNCCTNPSLSNCKQFIINTAHCALAISEIKRLSFPQIWGKCDASVVTDFCDNLSPTTQKVWAMVCEPDFKCPSEALVRLECLTAFCVFSKSGMPGKVAEVYNWKPSVW